MNDSSDRAVAEAVRRHFAEKYMEALIRADDLRKALERECSDADLILLAIGLDPAIYRTESGALNIPKIKAAIAHPDEYPRTPPTGRSTAVGKEEWRERRGTAGADEAGWVAISSEGYRPTSMIHRPGESEYLGALASPAVLPVAEGRLQKAMHEFAVAHKKYSDRPTREGWDELCGAELEMNNAVRGAALAQARGDEK